MDLTPVRTVEGRDDQSWLGSAYGTESCQSVTLDVTKFTAGTHYPNGYFPSGLALEKQANGTYGPYTDRIDGFLFTAISAPRAGGTAVQGALLDHGRVRVARLPITIDATAQATNQRFIFA